MTPAILRHSAFSTDPSGGNPAGVHVGKPGEENAGAAASAGKRSPPSSSHGSTRGKE